MKIAELKRRWTLRPETKSKEFQTLRDAMGFDITLTQLLWSRGIRDFEAARRFFRPTREHLHPASLMADMDLAVERILKAIHSGERILVYGDYDVDGTTAVTVVSSFLERYTDSVGTYVPDRYAEGYGLSRQGVEFASDNGFTVIIALDCGIKAHENAQLAKKLGVDLIICDHHTPAETLPEAYAILDPKRTDCTYPYKELSGCGIGYKLCCGLAERMGLALSELDDLLDLVVVSIGADIVSMTGENRVLATLGLARLNQNPRPAFAAMKEMSQQTELSITDVVFTIAPRINAAGRISHADAAITLLKSTSKRDAEVALSEINEHNATRRNLDQSITEEARIRAEEEGMEYSTVVYNEDWHKGVIGIVASRLIETRYRPTIVFTRSGEVLSGSARSVAGFNVYEALEACSDYLVQFGGHAYAAGMTMEESQLSAFREAFDDAVKSRIAQEQLQPEIFIDGPLDLPSINDQFIRRLMMFHPHGPDNDLPVFHAVVENTSSIRRIGSDKNHLKFSWHKIDAIGFGMGHWAEALESNQPMEAVFHIEYNTFRGVTNPQLRLLDIRLLEE